MRKPFIFMRDSVWRVIESGGALCTLRFTDIRAVAAYYGLLARPGRIIRGRDMRKR